MHTRDSRAAALPRRRARRAALLPLALAALYAPPVAAAQGPLTHDDAIHVGNRLTFGPTDAIIAAVTGPYDAKYYDWMKRQLHPGMVTQNPDLAPALAGLALPTSQNDPATSLAEIQKAQFVHALLDARQIQEVLAYFWEVHFNTSWSTIRFQLGNQSIVPAGQEERAATWLEWQDNQLYRKSALGTFRELLRLTTLSPGMMLYLNQNINSGCSNPNENYAREFLELYAMGPNHEATGAVNYVQADVVCVARCFTGWGLVNTPPLTATFTAANHCAGARTLFAGTPHVVTIPASGANQLTDVIDHVVASDATKDFICRKLMRYFLSDAAGAPGVHDALLARMKTAWGVKGDLLGVLLELFTSAEFLGPTYRWCRARTAFEKAVWWPRVWDGTLRRIDNNTVDVGKISAVRTGATKIGEDPFLFPSPDGIPLASVEQPGSSVTIETYDYVARTLWDLGAPSSAPLNYYPNHPTLLFQLIVQAGLPSSQHTSPSAIATLFLDRIYGSSWTTIDHQAVTDALARDVFGNLTPLDPNDGLAYHIRLGLGAIGAGSLINGSLK